MSPSQTNLFPVLNQGLFSTNFLDTKFLDFSIWNDTAGLLERTSQAREIILAAYNSAKRAGVFEVRDEQKTEDKFIRPVLKALGWVYDPQPRHKRGKAKVRPDYALFASTEDYEDQNQTIAPMPNPLSSPANRMIRQGDSPSPGIASRCAGCDGPEEKRLQLRLH